jgi:glycosyltransferase involved in cell wall biosynthesis
MQKKVLIFSLAYYPKNVGGAEVAIHEITDRISEDDVTFHMVTLRFYPDQPAVERIGNVVVHRIGNRREALLTRRSKPLLYLSKIVFIVRAAREARSLHAVHQFDASWAMMSYMTLPVVLARLLGVRIPYGITLQEGDSHEHVFSRLHILPFMPLVRYAFRHARAVQAISTFLADWARELGFPGDVLVIPNGVSAEMFAAPVPEIVRREIATLVGKRSGELWLIHTGRYVHKNALDVVVRALPLLPPRVHFLAVGEGSEQRALRALAEKLGVNNRYHEHPYVPISELPKFLQVCDVFVRPSRTEGMGNSFIEAMAAGLPVIGTRAGGITDFLFGKESGSETQTGWVAHIDSPEDIATALGDIEGDHARRDVVIARARTMVQHRYEWGAISHNIRTRFLDTLFVSAPF